MTGSMQAVIEVIEKNTTDCKHVWRKWWESIWYISVTMMGKLPFTPMISKYEGDQIFVILSITAGKKFKIFSCWGLYSLFHKDPLDLQGGATLMDWLPTRQPPT